LNAVIAGNQEVAWWLRTVECRAVVWFALPFRCRLLDQLAWFEIWPRWAVRGIAR
jgi:hypothetical protein